MKIKKFDTVSEAYASKELMGEMIGYASKHIYRKDQALDVVHDAFAKALDYETRKPGKNVKVFYLFRELARACRRFNKSSKEVSSGLFNEPETEDSTY